MHDRKTGAVLALGAVLAACGMAGAALASGASNRVSGTLIDDDGAAMPVLAQALPADASALTRAGLYATGAQATDLERALGAGVVHVTVGADAEAAVAGVQRALQRRRLGPDAPVLLSGNDLRTAARVADRLGEAGLSRVWVVTR